MVVSLVLPFGTDIFVPRSLDDIDLDLDARLVLDFVDLYLSD